MKKTFLLLVFIYFSYFIFSEEFIFDLNFATMGASKVNIGNIQIRNINDLRKENKKNEPDFIGNLRDGYGGALKCKSTIDVDIILKNLIIESLKYAGFNAVDFSQSDKTPVLDIDIEDLYMDGYAGFYGITVKLKLKLLNPVQNEILYEKSIRSSAFLVLVWGGKDIINIVVTNAYHRALNRILKIASLVFNSQNFINSYQGNKYESKEDIDLSKNKLTEIPTNIKGKENSEVLIFYDNKITKIKNLDDLNSLKELDLSSNSISIIENLDKLENLKVLSLANNKISIIQNLENLKNLEDLDLNNNKISKIENLNNLTNLKWLILSTNSIDKIQNLDKLNNLMFLDLSYNFKIKNIENLDKNNKLVWLNLTSTGITTIQNIENLSYLIYLDFSNCEIKKIENLDSLKNLLYLSLSFNLFIKKIEGLENLISLKKLNLSDSLYKKIEGLDNLKNLEELNLSRNPIKKIENLDNLINLKILNLAFTDISVIENLENLKNIESLIISPLRIRKIKKSTYDFLKSKNWKFAGVSIFKKKYIYLDDFIKQYNITIE